MPRAVCPTSADHDRFVTVAHVAEDWVVRGDGSFIETTRSGPGEVVAPPREGNTWTCLECGAEAAVSG